jgi:hypothetical protein
MKNNQGRIRRKLGPVGLSLVAALVTAIGFAAVSLAADNGNSGNSSSNNQSQSQTRPQMGPPPGGAPFGQNLSDSDKQKLDEFKTCMQDNGAPAPPQPGSFENGSPPDPPSASERAKVQKAYEACKDKLPEKLQGQGPPHPPGPCGPPPNGQGQAPGQQQGSSQGQNQNQSGTAQAPSGAAS